VPGHSVAEPIPANVTTVAHVTVTVWSRVGNGGVTWRSTLEQPTRRHRQPTDRDLCALRTAARPAHTRRRGDTDRPATSGPPTCDHDALSPSPSPSVPPSPSPGGHAPSPVTTYDPPAPPAGTIEHPSAAHTFDARTVTAAHAPSPVTVFDPDATTPATFDIVFDFLPVTFRRRPSLGFLSLSGNIRTIGYV
jgi:hypothetical protein